MTSITVNTISSSQPMSNKQPTTKSPLHRGLRRWNLRLRAIIARFRVVIKRIWLRLARSMRTLLMLVIGKKRGRTIMRRMRRPMIDDRSVECCRRETQQAHKSRGSHAPRVFLNWATQAKLLLRDARSDDAASELRLIISYIEVTILP